MVSIKKIKFDNPNLYFEDKLKIGDIILLGQIGIWTITSIDKQNYFWCGGAKTDFKKGDKYDKIFKPSVMQWLNSLHQNFKIGDFIIGYYNSQQEKKECIGKVCSPSSSIISQEKIWIEDIKDGYTKSLNVLTCRHLTYLEKEENKSYIEKYEKRN